MMNQQERREAMDHLQDFIGKMVTVNFIYYADEPWHRTGKLVGVEPYSHIVVDPYEYYQDLGLVTGNRFYELTPHLEPFAVHFVKEGAGIRSINEFEGDGTERILYENQWIIPRFNPGYENTRNTLVEQGAIKVKDNAEDIDFHVRKLSFGKEIAETFTNKPSLYDPHRSEKLDIQSLVEEHNIPISRLK